MPSAHLVVSTPITRTPRVMQTESIFEITTAQRSEVTIDVDLPLDDKPWNVGLIVGPSGAGKSTIVRHLFEDDLLRPWRWPQDKSVLDGFPAGMSIKDITELLSSVGFSSPPAWLRPFNVLSNGEKFRVTIAHALAQDRPLTVVDEFTSVVDRTVARIGSAAIARTVRARKQQFIAASCHYDIVEWLDPDWVFEPHVGEFRWRALQGRPPIPLTLARVHRTAWRFFAHAHYLDHHLNTSSNAIAAFIDDDTPVAFVAVLAFPHNTRPGWRIHRAVCLPDFQGVGIGTRVTSAVASLYKTTKRPVYITTSHPAMMRHFARSQTWKTLRAPSLTSPLGRHSSKQVSMRKTLANNRYTAGFEYIGPAADIETARRFGVPV